MTHILEADGIQLEINGKKLLSDIYLKCTTGKITGILGRNGQGKSCLMKIIYGTLQCEKCIRFDSAVYLEPFKQRGFLLYLPQFNFIPKSLSVKRVFKDFNLDFNYFCKTFPEFSLKYTSAVSTLSGGELRLLELYTIVKSPSRFAMLDEPFTHLNPIQIEKVKQLLAEEKINKGLLITDHMFRHVAEISETLYLLRQGKTHLLKNLADVETLGYANL